MYIFTSTFTCLNIMYLYTYIHHYLHIYRFSITFTYIEM